MPVDVVRVSYLLNTTPLYLHKTELSKPGIIRGLRFIKVKRYTILFTYESYLLLRNSCSGKVLGYIKLLQLHATKNFSLTVTASKELF